MFHIKERVKIGRKNLLCKIYVEWSVDFQGNEDKLQCSVMDSVFKIKCLPFYNLVGQTFTITAESMYSSTSLIVEVIGL